MNRTGERGKPTRRMRVRYAFDRVMARGPVAIIGLLALIVVAVVVVFTAIHAIFGLSGETTVTTAYEFFLQTMLVNLAYSAFGSAVIYASVSLVGLMIFGAFLGAVVTGMNSRLDRLRQGRSVVLERDHTLILGWSPRVFRILSELSVANESRRRPSVVILAQQPKPQMEDAIRERVPDMRNTRVVCRTGNPVVWADLELVNHRQARSVIVLGRDGDGDGVADKDSDADVIKTLLALTHDGVDDSADRHIVAEVQHVATQQAAGLIDEQAIVLINKPETIGRLIVQTSRQAGAAAVYLELLDFASSEIYMRRDDSLTGLTYLDAMLGYEQCTVIGLMHASGQIVLNPSADTVLQADDSVIAIAEDDSVLDRAVYARAQTEPDQIAIRAGAPPTPDSTLILGYNQRTPLVISELAAYAEPGARAVLVTDVPVEESALSINGKAAANLTVEHHTANTNDRAVLDRLDVLSYDRVIVMSYADHLPAKRAGGRLLLTLLHLRDIASHSGSSMAIVSEILDVEDIDLVRDAGVNDIVVSDEVLSLMLTQIAENRHLADVYRHLFQAEGAELYLRPVEVYVTAAQPVSFATLIEAASRRGETAIGYSTASKHGRDPFAIHVNPVKTRVFDANAGDRLIVLAEQ
ncbi:MAG: potassium transporter TrkA [Chloroflexota bacterium]|nr:potassium transporter TrkA [Chloroflexota bacterium]